MAFLVGIARAKGASGYLGDGTNRWPAVHRLDTAQLFRLAFEKARRDRPCTRWARRACRSTRSTR